MFFVQNDTLWFTNINVIPFRFGCDAWTAHVLYRSTPVAKDRLTHVLLKFTWNLSPLQTTRFSIVYLLLLPRSALLMKLHSRSRDLLHCIWGRTPYSRT